MEIDLTRPGCSACIDCIVVKLVCRARLVGLVVYDDGGGGDRMLVSSSSSTMESTCRKEGRPI